MPMPRLVESLRDKINSMSSWVLALLSLACAIVGGAAAAACWVGGLIKGSAEMLPWYLGLVLTVILAIAGICDLVRDLFPNRFAVYAAIFLPSLFRQVHGTIGVKVHGWTDAINAWSHQHMGDLLGQGSATFVAMLGIAGAVMLANKVAAKARATAYAGKDRTGALAGR